MFTVLNGSPWRPHSRGPWSTFVFGNVKSRKTLHVCMGLFQYQDAALASADSPHRGQWRGALICAWTNGWASNWSRRRLFETPSRFLWRDVTVLISQRHQGHVCRSAFRHSKAIQTSKMEAILSQPGCVKDCWEKWWTAFFDTAGPS